MYKPEQNIVSFPQQYEIMNVWDRLGICRNTGTRILSTWGMYTTKLEEHRYVHDMGDLAGPTQWDKGCLSHRLMVPRKDSNDMDCHQHFDLCPVFSVLCAMCCHKQDHLKPHIFARYLAVTHRQIERIFDMPKTESLCRLEHAWTKPWHEWRQIWTAGSHRLVDNFRGPKIDKVDCHASFFDRPLYSTKPSSTQSHSAIHIYDFNSHLKHNSQPSQRTTTTFNHGCSRNFWKLSRNWCFLNSHQQLLSPRSRRLSILLQYLRSWTRRSDTNSTMHNRWHKNRRSSYSRQQEWSPGANLYNWSRTTTS